MAGGGRYNHAEGDLAELPASSDDGWADTEPFPLGPEDGDEGGVAFAPRRPGLVIDASAGYRAEAALPPPPSPSGPDRRSHRGLPALAWRPVVPALRWALPLAALLTVGLYAGLSNRPGTLASQSATVAPPVTQAVPGAVASSTTVVQLPATATPPLALAPAVVAAPVEAARALALEDLPPTAAGAPGPALRWSVGSDADSATESTMLAQLARVSAADRPKAVLANARVGVGAGAEFAIARYDALKARPANWHVVAPLNTEELYAVVRADSPWRSLDELRGRRINVGAAGSARALSGTTLYRQMFGTALPIASATGLGRDAALQALLDGVDVDALWVFDGQPSAWLANLPLATRQRLRLLGLGPDMAASRRALQVYLPARVASPLRADGDSVESVGVVTFLVASATAIHGDELLGALCAHLSDLRREGHPKWREVHPESRLPTGLPSLADDARAQHACQSSAESSEPSTLTAGLKP